MKKSILYIGLICLLSGSSLKAQQPATEGKVDYPVFLDKGDDLGKVTVFQSKDNPNDYYYLPNQVRVKANEQGILQMGFQQYVKNEKSAADAEETRTKGSGGGYFWMTVGFGLSAEERQDVERELQRRRPGARLMGAMAYESGTAELLSFGIKDKTDSKTEMLGVANAPLMEGDAVSVSMILDAENATKLWESLKLPVPGIGMNFSMNFRGYHSPVSAKITMDMEKIYKHQKMSVGIQAPFLGAEIEDLTKDLMNTGAIKVEQTGDIGGKWEDILKEVLDNFRSECFSPMNNMMDMMYSQNNEGESPLDRAETLRQRRNGNNQAYANGTQAYANGTQAYTNGTQAYANGTQANANVTQTGALDTQANANVTQTGALDTQANANVTQTGALDTQANANVTQTGALDTQANANVTQANANGIQTNANGTQTNANGTQTNANGTQANANVTQANANGTQTNANGTQANANGTQTNANGTQTNANGTQTNANGIQTIPQTAQPPQNNNNNPANNLGISIYAGFQMKNIRTRGKKTFELNKIRTANRNRNIALVMPRFPKANLQQINLDDPLYRQRELVTMIDGFSSRDFGQYINFVNVTMRKKHPKGDVSTDEVVINRTNFNKEGNRFKLLYGWKPGDNDRRTWMDYDYKTVWSFFGGGEMTDDWQSSQKGVINVAPPCRKEVIKLEGDPEELKQKDVRAINVKISYTVAGVKRSVLKFFNLSKAEPLAAEVEIIQPNNVFEYDYEIIWQLKGNRTVTTGLKKGEATTLFMDELPQ